MVRKQFGDDHDTQSVTHFTFSTDGKSEPAIEIHFDQLQQGSWILTMETPRKVNPSEEVGTVIEESLSGGLTLDKLKLEETAVCCCLVSYSNEHNLALAWLV